MTERRGNDWRALLLAIGGGGAGMVAVVAAGSTLTYAAAGRWLWPQNSERLDPVALAVLAGGLGLIGILMLVVCYRAFGFLGGRTDNAPWPGPIRTTQAWILLLVWLASSLVAQLVVDQEPWRWIAPALHLLGIGTPLYLLIRVALGGIRGGSKLRLWGTLATGVVLSTGIAALAEMALLLATASAAGVYLALNPDQLPGLQSVVVQLSRTSGVEDAVAVVEPWLVHPLMFIVALTAMSGIVPIVEELAKSAAPWAVFDRLSTPAQGFCAGAVSGAGFALFEGLLASSDASGNSATILLMRAGSSMMHVVASAVAGWGIAAFRIHRRAAYLLGGYAVALGIHALWNGSVVTIAYGAIRSGLGSDGVDLAGSALIAAGVLVLTALLALLPGTLIILNRKLRSPRQDATSAADANGARSGALARLQS